MDRDYQALIEQTKKQKLQDSEEVQDTKGTSINDSSDDLEEYGQTKPS